MEKVFRIANFNAENFNAPGIRYAGRPGDDGKPPSEDMYNAKLAWMKQLLASARPDVIGFEELFSETALKDVVAATMPGASIFAPDIADDKNLITEDGHDAARGPYCGLVSRFPILAATEIAEFPDAVKGQLRVPIGDANDDTIDVPIKRFQRPVLRVELNLRPDAPAPVPAVVFVAHLKSKRGHFLAGEDSKDPIVKALGAARSLIIRAAEAAALRALVVAGSKGNDTPVIVLGDLNDDLASVTTQTIGGDDPYFLRAEDKAAAYDTQLHSVHDLQEQASYRAVSYSHIFGGRYELLDHIFVSQEFVAKNPKRIATVRNTRMFNDHLYDTRLEADRQKPSPTSDHGIPVTEIEWKD